MQKELSATLTPSDYNPSPLVSPRSFAEVSWPVEVPGNVKHHTFVVIALIYGADIFFLLSFTLAEWPREPFFHLYNA